MLQLKKINLLATKNILNKWETGGYFLKEKACFAFGRMEKSDLVVLQNEILSLFARKNKLYHINKYLRGKAGPILTHIVPLFQL